MRRLAWAIGPALVCLGLVGPAAWAVIMRLVPLREVLAESPYICVVKVERLEPDRPAVVLTVSEDLKGKAPFRRLPVNLTGDSEAQKDQHTAKLLKRLAPDLPLLLFVTERGKRYTAFGYTGGTWFQALGQKNDDAVRWTFTHCEPYLRRTFKGTTAELREIVVDGLAGKRKPPEPDPKEPPGLGPELEKEKKGQGAGGTGPVFGVIPTVLAGPLALLALLFPAVFGGLMLGLRRWLAALSVVSLNSTLFLAHGWFYPSFQGHWWSSPSALWAAMTLITLVGTLWAWRRQRAAVRAGAASVEPGRLERIAFWTLTATGLAVVASALYSRESLLAPTQKTMLVVWVGVWAGTVALALRQSRAGPARFSPEGVMLGAMLLAYVGLGALTWPRGPAAAGAVRMAWEFRTEDRGQFLASPFVAGDHVYVAAAHAKGLTTYGILYCLDRATGAERWRFDDDGGMQQVFSSPCLADGRLYVGEGLHEDRGCKLYCLNAETGAKLWEFTTSSHVESSPCVADGTVFVGAGDDGVYALDAATGKLLWNFNEGLHIDASPVVEGGRLYVGSGVSRRFRQTEIVCLNTDTGRPLWRTPVDLPAWGMPVVAGGRLFVGLGNGNFLQSDATRPAGALLCLDGAEGRRLWRYDVHDSVLGRPAVVGDNVFFGCRDGRLYCLAEAEGRLRWKQELGSPVVSSPMHSGGRVYAATTAGRLVCFGVETGVAEWTFDLSQHAQADVRVFGSPAVVTLPAGTERRQILFSAGVGGELRMAPVLYCLVDW